MREREREYQRKRKREPKGVGRDLKKERERERDQRIKKKKGKTELQICSNEVLILEKFAICSLQKIHFLPFFYNCTASPMFLFILIPM